MNRGILIGVAILLTQISTNSLATPNLADSRQIEQLTIVGDDKKGWLYYYLPGDLVLSQQEDGKPDLQMLQIRYTGTTVRDNQQFRFHRSILTFRIAMKGPTTEQIIAAKRSLSFHGRHIELRPLPIRRLETALVYTPVVGDEGTPESKLLPAGHVEENEESESSSKHAYWEERTYTVALDSLTSQIFWEALQKGQIVLSLGYGFFANVKTGDQSVSLTGSPELVESLRQEIQQAEERESKTQSKTPPVLIKAGATSITVDVERWPDLLHRVDLNESLPPGYAVLDIYCYDFNNELRPDLFKKEVEIEAEGVGDQKVKMHTVFHSRKPDIYAKSIHFPFAVRLDRPFRYRVIEITRDGDSNKGVWTERESWTQLLDITTQLEEGDSTNDKNKIDDTSPGGGDA